MVNKIIAVLLGGIFSFALSVSAQATPYNYAEVMQKVLFFYAAQRSGVLPADNPVIWRADSGLGDGSDVGLDLTGGWYDAGDHVKFGLPMASTALTLSWAVYEYRTELDSAGLLDDTLETIRWATNYFIKAHPSPNEFYYQVGDGSDDHGWWGPVEVIEEVMARPAFKITLASPGSTVAGATAAALAAASFIFRPTDPGYADICLQHARELYEFADNTRSDAGYSAATGFYNSFSGYWDELSAAAIWLYIATSESRYLDQAETAAMNWPRDSQGRGRRANSVIAYKWTHSWDDMHYMASILLARHAPSPAVYIAAVERNLDYWMPGGGVGYTSGGLAWLDQWGSLRYAANAAFLALIWADTPLGDASKKDDYRNFSIDQINYMLGNNPRNSSYVVGFGANPPRNPHHRTSHGAWYNDIDAPAENRHVLFGALVGGPDSNDNYADDRTDYVQNEVANDYNAGFFGALVRINSLHPGALLTDFPEAYFKPVSERLPEFFVRARLLSEEATSIKVITQTANRSAWPASVKDDLKYRYFFDLTETYAAGYSVSDISVSQQSSEAGAVSGPIHWDGSVYYLEVDLSGTKIFPGGRSESEKSTTFTISGPSDIAWDTGNDWSRRGMVSNFTYEPEDYSGMTEYIPLYEGETLVFGREPGDIPPAPDRTDMYVQSIDLTSASQGPRLYAIAEVMVMDEEYNPVPDVAATFTWSGFVTGSATVSTDVNGVARFSSPKKKGSGTVTLTVDHLSKPEFEYREGMNVETYDSIGLE